MKKIKEIPLLTKKQIAYGIARKSLHTEFYPSGFFKRMTSGKFMFYGTYYNIYELIQRPGGMVRNDVAVLNVFEMMNIEKMVFTILSRTPPKPSKSPIIGDQIKSQLQSLLNDLEKSIKVDLPTNNTDNLSVRKKKNRDYNQIKKELKSIIFGQDQAIDDVIKKVMRKDFSLDCDRPRPVSMFWAGPTGVGKTETALQLAKQLHLPVVRIDMSEYMHDHEVSKLIGAPPGYKGSNQPTLLEPCSGKECLIVFDEIEKAHSNIFNIFLQILDYGVLTNGKGEQIDLTKAIIVMTSNVGAQEMNERKIGLADETLDSRKSTVLNAMNNQFSPEFINRLSSIQIFNSLNKTILDTIIQSKMKLILSAVKEKYNLEVSVSDLLKKELDEKSFSPLMGARPVDRAIEALILEPLSHYVMSQDSPADCIELCFDGKTLIR
jgi:ATP-dependent Clp protease ATP-binding subunit ClpA